MSRQPTQFTELQTLIEDYLCCLVSDGGYSFEEVTAVTNGIVMRSVAVTYGREAAMELCHETAQSLIEAFAPTEQSTTGKPAVMGNC